MSGEVDDPHAWVEFEHTWIPLVDLAWSDEDEVTCLGLPLVIAEPVLAGRLLEEEDLEVAVSVGTEDAVAAVGTDPVGSDGREIRAVTLEAIENGAVDVGHEGCLPVVSAGSILQRFVDQGDLVRHGRGKSSSYSLKDLPASKQLLLYDSQGLAPSSQGLAPSSQGLAPSSQGLMQGSDAQWWHELTRITRHIRERKKNSKKVVRGMIVELCSKVPLTAAEIATLLGLSKPYVQNEYLGEMVKNGNLMYQQAAPTDPDQRYIVPPGSHPAPPS